MSQIIYDRNLNGSFEILTSRIRKSLKEREFSIVEVNLEYPQIKTDESKFENSFNLFFRTIAENYANYCETKLNRKLKRYSTASSFKTHAEIMKYYITYNSNRFVSVVADISHFDGYFTKSERFSFVWDVKKIKVVPYLFFYGRIGKSINDIRSEIKRIILESIENGEFSFSYTEKSIKKYSGKINPENYFLTDEGIAFWFEKGTIAPESEGYPTFILKYDYNLLENC